MYFSYLDPGNSFDERKYNIITFISEYFDSNRGDHYYIMDPYFNVLESIEYPLRSNSIEMNNWSFLLSELSNKDVKFKIITRQSIGGSFITLDPPFLIPLHGSFNWSTIEICKYIDTKFYNLSIHDRFIIKENGDIIKGIHIGPSLGDIDGKDVSLTFFSKEGSTLAVRNFKRIWHECIDKKGWKKG